jgi:hypothetical protein
MRTVIVALLAANCALPQANLRGVFNGDWIGTSTSGDIRISITGDAKPVVEVIFTIANNEVKTRVTSADVTPKSFEVTYEFDLGGNKLQSAIKGYLEGSRLEGTYKTTRVSGGTQVDEGTWKATKNE